MWENSKLSVSPWVVMMAVNCRKWSPASITGAVSLSHVLSQILTGQLTVNTFMSHVVTIMWRRRQMAGNHAGGWDGRDCSLVNNGTIAANCSLSNNRVPIRSPTITWPYFHPKSHPQCNEVRNYFRLNLKWNSLVVDLTYKLKKDIYLRREIKTIM